LAYFHPLKLGRNKTQDGSFITLARRRLDTLYAMLRDGTFYQDPVPQKTDHNLAKAA